MRIHINNIDELIEAYKNDVINTSQLLKIMSDSFPKHIAIWVDEDGYNETKENTLKGLQNYKRYLESGNDMPFFFPFLSDTEPDEFSFNDCLSGGKNQ